MEETTQNPDAGRRRFRKTLVSVMLVQIATLTLLWLLQARYTVG